MFNLLREVCVLPPIVIRPDVLRLANFRSCIQIRGGKNPLPRIATCCLVTIKANSCIVVSFKANRAGFAMNKQLFVS